ncbi:MAG: PAS domain-containing protein, partial [Anaerolineae bacterium]|nr:PAS domain-containing protein [Anaerolineae bacterium]
MEKSSEPRRRLQKKLGQQLTPEMSALSTQEVANLIQELQLYQAELKLQNEELRQTQQQLGASQQRYVELYDLLRTLIDHLPTYVYIKDTESRFLLGNSAVVQVMNAPSAEALLGKTDFDFFPEALATQYYADEQQIIRSGQPIINKKEPLIDPAGRKRWLSTTKVPLRDADGNIIGLVGIGRDITERSYAEQRIKLLQSITQNISEATDFQAALTRTLNRIGQVTGW